MNSPQRIRYCRSPLPCAIESSIGSIVRLTSQWLAVAMVVSLMSGCSTAVAVADAVGSAAVYSVKTVVNTVDAVTPDIVNDDDDD